MNQAAFVFGTVGSPYSTPPKPGGSIGAIQRLAELGLYALELGWVRSVRIGEDACAAIKAAAAEAGVKVSVHAPYYINLNADAEEWPKSRQRLMDAAHYGNLAGATDIIFHPGSYFERSPEEVLQKAVPRLRGCVDELRAAGNPVTLRPETMGKSAMLGSIDDVIAMARQIDGVEPCLDFSHLHARPGDGSVNSYDEWKKLLTGYANGLGKEALKRLHCHLSGIEYGEKGEKNHLRLIDSDLDLNGLIDALVDLDTAGRILCESPERMEDDAAIIKQTWEGTREQRE